MTLNLKKIKLYLEQLLYVNFVNVNLDEGKRIQMIILHHSIQSLQKLRHRQYTGKPKD
jgi:acid stress-induced BolA-like protein IbaG/YrbA